MDQSMKKIMYRTTAAAMTLSLTCTPALAASFDDVQNAVDGDTGAGVRIEDSEHDNHYGYGDQNADTGFYGVESWNDPNVTGGSYIQLNEDVSKEDGTLEGISVGSEDGNVSLDLNGYDMVSDHYDPDLGTSPVNTPVEGESYGSVIQVGQDANLTIKDTSSENTEEQGNISGGFGIYDGGGGVMVDGGTLNVEGGNISNNASFWEGSAIGARNGGTVNMSGGSIHDNANGGIKINGKGSTLAMTDGTIKNNGSQGIHAGEGAKVTLDGGAITGNKNSGIYLDNGSQLIMNGGTISGNEGANGGGVMLNDYDTWAQSTMIMNGGTIADNKASNFGGGIYSAGKSLLTVNDGTIENNTASYGGGIYAQNLDMKNGLIANNRAEYFGGGVSVQDTMTMADGTISGNTTSYGGGGITTNHFVMKDGVIENNSADYGGGINAGGQMDISGGTIRNNIATGSEGGGIHIAGHGRIEAAEGKNIYITGNKTLTKDDLGGGGLYVAGCGSLELMNVVITNNMAGMMGGGLAACHTGRNFVYATDGGAIFGNMANAAMLEAFNRVNNDVDGGNIWKAWTAPQRKLFLEAAQDIFSSGQKDFKDFDAGAIVGNIMLGTPEYGSTLDDLTPEQIQEVAKHLYNWLGYRAMDSDSSTLHAISAGNNGTIYSDHFLALTAHPLEEARRDAMEKGRVFITDNEAVYNHGGGIANNGTLVIGKECSSISTMPNVLLETTWLDPDDNVKELKGDDFSFELKGGKIADADGNELKDRKIKTLVTKNDPDGNAMFGMFSNNFLTEPGTYQFTLREHCPEEQKKTGLQYDRTEYRITFRTGIDKREGTIGKAPYRTNTLVLHDFKVEKIKDAKGNVLDTPEPVSCGLGERVQFLNTTYVERPDDPLDPHTPDDPDGPDIPDEPDIPDNPTDQTGADDPEQEQPARHVKRTAAAGTKAAAQKTNRKTASVISSEKKSPDTGISLQNTLHRHFLSFLGLGAIGTWFVRKRK